VPEPWHDFFVAQAGASAALAGLMFVALSLNIEKILKSPWLPPRGAATMVLLIGSLIQALVALWPADKLVLPGLEELVLSVIVWAYATWLLLAGARTPKQYGGTTIGVVLTQVATLPAVAGAIAIVAFGAGEGVYAIAISLLMAIVVGIINSWVLLVEILR
jgi:hypothetical protein